MFPGKEATGYPTQWALNPSAYQNIDANQVDWAALAQQWIAMKEATVTLVAPPPPSIKQDEETGEAPMDVETSDTAIDIPPIGAGDSIQGWSNNSNSWGNDWNQWGKFFCVNQFHRSRIIFLQLAF